MSINWMSKKNPHILAIPWPATGHILPMIDAAHQLALRGITVTFAVTPKNLYYLNPLMSLHNKSTNIQTLVVPLPSHPSLPAGSENMQDVTQDYFLYMVEASSQLHDPILQWFKSHPCPPVAILTDAMNTTWTHPLASVLGIKTISFMASNQYIASTVWSRYKEMKKEFFNGEMLHNTIDSWGLVLNSFTEMHTKSFGFDAFKAMAKHGRVWGVSPLLPVQAAGSERGGPAAMPSHEVLAWLDSCDALEKCGVRFIWAVKKPGKVVENESGDQSVVPAGLADRVAGRGLVIKGWVPQSVILKHRAVGSYLSHLGWGSLFDGLMGGVLLLTWPMRPDHFMNKQLIVDELGAAIPVCEGLDTVPDSAKVAQILAWMKIRDKALNAAKQGGSAYKALDDLATQIANLAP
ncbi:hypothetical protein Ddye_023730 [Dipteronia dyeriana]|uniref:UDP-glycosyltransferase n=1 Tax=Dipteronia dyeriana TaxID=168575 RepID=A0AAD9TTZ8_9ROSI|nr:hypothetical protein Ddye_023730 [Dipteronia dyeriana]